MVLTLEQTAANTLAILAVRGTELIPKSPINTTMITSRGLVGNEVQWTTDENDRHHASCGDNI